MLEAPQPHTVQRTKRQLQDDEITIDDRSTCVDGSAKKRDINPTTMRPMEADTFEESKEFGHCILARTQQNITKMRPEGRSCYKYTYENDASRGVKTSR